MNVGTDDADRRREPGSESQADVRVPVVRLTGAALLAGAIFGVGMAVLGEHQIAFSVCLGGLFALSLWVFFYLMLRSRLPLDRSGPALRTSRVPRSMLLIGVYAVMGMATVLIALETDGAQVGWRRWIAPGVVVSIGVVSVLLLVRRPSGKKR